MTTLLLALADAAKAQRAPSCHFRHDSSMGQPSLLTDANQSSMTMADSVLHDGWFHPVADVALPSLYEVS